MKTLTRLANGADRMVRAVGNTMAWTGLAMVLLIAFNVIVRYVFSYGIVAFQEMEWHLMAVGALFGMSYALNSGDEVRVDVLYGSFSDRAKLVVDAISSLLLLIVCLIVVYLSVGFVAQSFALSEGSADPGGLPMRWLLKACIPVAFLLLALQAFAKLVVETACLLDADLAAVRRPAQEG